MLSIVVLPVPVPPLTRMLRLIDDAGPQELAAGDGDRAELDQVVHREALGGELADRQARPAAPPAAG